MFEYKEPRFAQLVIGIDIEDKRTKTYGCYTIMLQKHNGEIIVLKSDTIKGSGVISISPSLLQHALLETKDGKPIVGRVPELFQNGNMEESHNKTENREEND